MAGAEAYLPLLRMSIGLQQAPNQEAPKEMEPERKEWLKEAMSNLLKNPVDDMKLICKNLQDEKVSEEEKVQALESLAGFVEQIDLARDLHKIGGLKLVIDLLKSPNYKIRASAAQVVGTVVHNNPEPQKWASELGALENLTAMLKQDDATPLELSKALFGVSSLIRQNDAATVQYVKDLKGVAVILEILRKDTDNMLPAHRKAIFVLLYLVTRAPAIVPSTALHSVPTVSSALSLHASDPDFRENALLVLRAYSKNDKVTIGDKDKQNVVASATKAMLLAKQNEHDNAVEMCEELIACWRIS